MYLEDSIARIAHEETERRRQKDAWLEPIQEWLVRPDVETGKHREVVTGKEVLEECIGISVSRMTNRELNRVAQIMVKELGWEKGKFHHKKFNKTVNGYRFNSCDLAALGLE